MVCIKGATKDGKSLPLLGLRVKLRGHSVLKTQGKGDPWKTPSPKVILYQLESEACLPGGNVYHGLPLGQREVEKGGEIETK